ncbi:MAG: hypothetical protein JWP99_1416 [Devosia sp.]|nr:hypothetical protein [Devosia sp.]
MKTQAIVQGSMACTLHCAPESVFAATLVELTAEVVNDPPCDLRGDYLVLLDEDDIELGRLVFTDFDAERNATSGRISLTAPSAPGRYTWHGRIEGFTLDELAFEETRVPVTITVAEHRTVVNVWGTPSAVEQGSRFPVNIGVKCTCGCSLGGQAFTVHDHRGEQRASGVLGHDTWAGSDALHFAALELSGAGVETGRHEWEVRFTPDELDLPHLPSSTAFSLVITPAPECVVTVEALDRAKQTPLAGAIVSMHPYRAATDARGIAELHVPKGRYVVFVSARKYVSDTAELVVDADISTQAQLAVEIRPERM